MTIEIHLEDDVSLLYALRCVEIAGSGESGLSSRVIDGLKKERLVTMEGQLTAWGMSRLGALGGPFPYRHRNGGLS